MLASPFRRQRFSPRAIAELFAGAPDSAQKQPQLFLAWLEWLRESGTREDLGEHDIRRIIKSAGGGLRSR